MEIIFKQKNYCKRPVVSKSFFKICSFLILKVSEAGVHRPHVGGIHGRSNDGAYSLVLAGGFEDEVVCHLCKQWFCCSNVSMFVKIELCHKTNAYENVTVKEITTTDKLNSF